MLTIRRVLLQTLILARGRGPSLAGPVPFDQPTHSGRIAPRRQGVIRVVTREEYVAGTETRSGQPLPEGVPSVGYRRAVFLFSARALYPLPVYFWDLKGQVGLN